MVMPQRGTYQILMRKEIYNNDKPEHIANSAQILAAHAPCTEEI
jgi:hypothetical protein